MTMIHRVRAARLSLAPARAASRVALDAAHLLDRGLDGFAETGGAPGPHPLRRRGDALLATQRHRVGEPGQVLAQERIEPIHAPLLREVVRGQPPERGERALGAADARLVRVEKPLFPGERVPPRAGLGGGGGRGDPVDRREHVVGVTDPLAGLRQAGDALVGRGRDGEKDAHCESEGEIDPRPNRRTSPSRGALHVPSNASMATRGKSDETRWRGALREATHVPMLRSFFTRADRVAAAPTYDHRRLWKQRAISNCSRFASSRLSAGNRASVARLMVWAAP